MKKIPTIFERDWNGDRSRVVESYNPVAQWVLKGEGWATRKLDGTSCMVQSGKLFRRRELKRGQPEPTGFISEGTDSETGKTVGWVLVGNGPEDAAHREAFAGLPPFDDGTYELVGPKVQGNPECFERNTLVAHTASWLRMDGAPRTFNKPREWLTDRDIEGLVFHHPDGRMAKIKLRDFGLKRSGTGDAHW